MNTPISGSLAHLPTLPLLRTKLFPADAGSRPQLLREALIERLYASRSQRLVILSAPAGFGKSTVLAQYRQRLLGTGARVAWLSCDEADSEPQRLLQYLVAAISAVAPGFGSATGGLLQGDVSWPQEALIDAFLADLKRLDGDVYIVLDDFHRIRHSAMGPAARYLIEHLPPTVHLLASTRYQSKLMVEEPSLKPWTLWLKAEDLRLSFDETAAYFREVKQLDLSRDELSQLHTRTEGWITALHLAALALARHPDRALFLAGLSGTERNIADYPAGQPATVPRPDFGTR